MQELQTIQEIFNNKIFRIPDYQRGFSWNPKHLEAFWQDLENLQENKLHFTGAITVERANQSQYKKWEDDEWIIEGKDFSPFYIVDGQQRLTTIVILIYVIYEKLGKNESLLFSKKTEILKKYIYNIYEDEENSNLKSYIFGYDIDNPSFEFLKNKIFSEDTCNSISTAETTYTNNLSVAKAFFRKKILNYDIVKLQTLFKKVTQRLKFDFQEIDKELDIFVVFETMNNRGKPLTNLELLKNRFIYLTTLLPDSDIVKKKLRRDINETWKIIYEYLGKDKNRELADDEFLRTHWIMYHRFSKEEEFYKKDIFDVKYTVKELIEGDLNFDEINKYISSLQTSVKQWYKIKNPVHAFEKEVFSGLDKETVKWLEKLNRLKFTTFEPLTLAVFCKNYSSELIIDYLQCVENFIFCVFKISNKQRNTEETYAYPNAKNLFIGKVDIETLISEIKEHSENHFKVSRFIEKIEEKKKGLYDWEGLQYFLYEYEEFLQGKNKVKVIDWSAQKDISIEHIFPQTLPTETIDSYWNIQFNGYDSEQRKTLCHSLGNLLLLSKATNAQLSNNSFDNKKIGTNNKGNSIGYYKGSYSEIEVSLYKYWNPQTIKERGERLLRFMQERWNIKLSKSQVRDILQLNFVKEA